jgi:hypothetical protein
MINKKIMMVLAAIPVMILANTVTYIPVAYTQSEDSTRNSILSELNAAEDAFEIAKDAIEREDFRTATQAEQEGEALVNSALGQIRNDPELSRELEEEVDSTEREPIECVADYTDCRDDCPRFFGRQCRIDCLEALATCLIEIVFPG